MKIFDYLYLFCFFCVFESLSCSNKVFDLVDNSGVHFSFLSQKIDYSDELKVYNYIIPRKDLMMMKSLSVYGFNSEDDMISLLLFLYENLKIQNLHHKYHGKMSVSFILSIEKYFENFSDPSNVTMVPDSDVVMAFEYVIKKSDPKSISKLNLLRENLKKDVSLVEKLFMNIGELSVTVLDSKNSLSTGSVIIKEDSSSYYIYYIASDPYTPVSISNVKTSIKNFIGMCLESKCSNIEN